MVATILSMTYLFMYLSISSLLFTCLSLHLSVWLSYCLTVPQVLEHCSVLSSSQMTCATPTVTPDVKVKGVWFQLDNVRVHFESIKV